MASYDGAGMWGAIGSSVTAFGNIYATAKTGQITADTLNKQSEIQDRAFIYGTETAAQHTKNTITIIITLAAAAIIALIVLVALKRKST